jgi:CDP-diacylglycerol--glycerol-3-phosphate 3-phosphatidyltransferase
MRNLLKTVPNQLTAARLALIPVMWILAALSLPFYIGVGILVCFLTDVLDGYIARRLGQTSEWGSQFDSIADNLLSPSGLVWIWLFRPEIYRENLAICAIAIFLFFASLLVGAVKFKRFANLHLYSSKAAAVVMFPFLGISLMMAGYSRPLFYLAAAMFIVSSAEALLLQLLFSRVNERMGSVVLALQRRDKLPQ